jgi:protein-L-isoaspartate(D-aspartate) O-methyltransferase
MSWRCSGRSNAELVTNLANAGIIKSTAVISAMRAVDRGFYAPAQPYQDAPQTIGYNATISAPHMHGYALEWLAEHLRPGSTALDVGCGSGYLTAVMAEMCGSCHGIDHIEGLVALSRENILKGNPSLLDEGRATLRVRDGFQGLAECGPYDAIHVGAAAPSLPPALVAQLKCGGKLVIPVGPDGGAQEILAVEKGADGRVTETPLLGVRYIPLTTPEKQLA